MSTGFRLIGQTRSRSRIATRWQISNSKDLNWSRQYMQTEVCNIMRGVSWKHVTASTCYKF